MVYRRYISVIISISTNRTGVLSISLLGARGGNDCCGIFVSCFYVRINLRIAANRTSMRSISLLGASGRNDCCGILMSLSVYVSIIISISANRTSVLSISLLGAGGSNYDFVIRVLVRRPRRGYSFYVMPEITHLHRFTFRIVITSGTCEIAIV